MALDQRKDDEEQCEATDRDTAQIEARRVLTFRLADDRAARGEGEEADRNVDEEDRPPAQSENVAAHEDATQEGSCHGGQSRHRSEDAEGLSLFVDGEGRVDDRHDLRHHQRGCRTLEKA